ncbi:MAG: lipopolysaccharide export system protein LptC [Methylophagaceae bacterium]|jgi:lipopolysaccharide export system protein LptC
MAKLLLSLLAIITLWLLFSNDTKQEVSDSNAISRTSDYAMSNFTMTVMDELGRPSRIITGQTMAHYPENDSTEITAAIAKILEQGKNTWIISANKAYTEGKGEDILLAGNVIITQKDNNAIELRTEKLNLDTLRDNAYTDLAVSMKSAHGTTHSVGLHASLQEKTINLHSRVKGHYDAPPTN